MNKKLKSRRFYIVIWAVVYISAMSVYLVEKSYEGSWVAGVMALVGGIIVSWMTVSSLKKKKEGE